MTVKIKEEKFLPYACPLIDDDDLKSTLKVIKSHCLTRGSVVKDFEKALAEYCRAKYAVCFSSGTAALNAAYHVVKMNSNDLILSTPNTFIATLATPFNKNARIQLLDIDENSGNLSTDLLKQTLNRRKWEKRIILSLVHFSGIPIELDSIIPSENLIILEDAAHALGARYRNGKKVGCCDKSDLTIFSFHPAKSITTGEGGAITTNNPEYYQKLLQFRNNGIINNVDNEKYPGFYEVHEITGNYHLTDFQAALGLSQLHKLDSFVEKRKNLVSFYRQNLALIEEISFFHTVYDSLSAHHLMVIKIDFSKLKTNRDSLMRYLRDNNIGTQVHYIPIYHHPFYHSKESKKNFPQMELYYQKALSLPLHCGMNEEEVLFVCRTLENFIRGVL